MTTVEDDLRALLHERAGAPPDNPTRPTEVRSRIRSIRRRRTITTALCLALVVVGGLLTAVTRPGPEPLPAGVPGPPYYDGHSSIPVAGFPTAAAPIEFDATRGIAYYAAGYRRLLLVAWCRKAGVLQVGTVAGPLADVPCRSRVGDHYEGAAAVSGEDAHRYLQPRLGDPVDDTLADDVLLRPSTAGEWRFAILEAALPDRLDPAGPTLLDGARDRAGGTFVLTTPSRTVDGKVGAFSILVECVEGVTLTFRVGRTVLTAVTCEESALRDGAVYAVVSPSAAARAGLRPRERFQVSVERGGRDTDQWRVVALQR